MEAPILFRLLPALLLMACSGNDDPVGTDLTGRYNVQIDGLSGCGEDPDLMAWMAGPLQISGDIDAPTFDFGGTFALTGGTTPGGAFSFGGVVREGDVEYAAFGSGTAFGEAGNRTLSGEGGAQIDDNDDPSDDCTINALFSAVQIGS